MAQISDKMFVLIGRIQAEKGTQRVCVGPPARLQSRLVHRVYLLVQSTAVLVTITCHARGYGGINPVGIDIALRDKSPRAISRVRARSL